MFAAFYRTVAQPAASNCLLSAAQVRTSALRLLLRAAVVARRRFSRVRVARGMVLRPRLLLGENKLQRLVSDWRSAPSCTMRIFADSMKRKILMMGRGGFEVWVWGEVLT